MSFDSDISIITSDFCNLRCFEGVTGNDVDENEFVSVAGSSEATIAVAIGNLIKFRGGFGSFCETGFESDSQISEVVGKICHWDLPPKNTSVVPKAPFYWNQLHLYIHDIYYVYI